MGKIINESTANTVEELIAALEKFPRDMQVSDGLSDYVTVYQIAPTQDDIAEDRRGIVVIEGE